ncbi:MAG TPA: DUF4347 domain-containing protein, partial [Chroococcidiopsis sp.]
MTPLVSTLALVFIDPSVNDYAQLVEGIHTGAEVFVLNPAEDGVRQITTALASYRQVNSLHIISHGQSGSLRLGATALSRETLNHYSQELTAWATRLAPGADILLYGCNVAADESGQAFVRQVAALTGANIAAASTLTGSAAQGGDWSLQFRVGNVQTPLAVRAEAIAAYAHVLADTNVLKLTSAVKDTSSFVLYTSPISSTNGLSISFDFFSYQGNGGDGLSFFFVDGAKSPTGPGGFGGSLGYAQYDAQPGLLGGYLGIGFDEFGNFSDPNKNAKVGGPGRRRDSIAVRGSESTGYNYLVGTSYPGGGSIDVPGSAATREEARRRARVDLSPAGKLFVKLDLNADNDFDDPGETVIGGATGFDVTAVNGALPSTFKFGFAASTGDSTNIHEIANFDVRTFNQDLIPGNFTDNLLIVGGGTGGDEITGGNGDDTITGGSGNDTVTG